MKRFIRYLYEYEQGQRKRNVGFVKVEQDEEACTLHIHGKGLRIESGISFRVYLFYAEGENCIGIFQGEIGYMGPALNYRLRYTKEDVGIPQNYEKVNGVLLEGSGSHKFAALWDEVFTDIEQMQIWQEKSGESVPIQEPVPMQEPEQSEDAGRQDDTERMTDIDTGRGIGRDIDKDMELSPDEGCGDTTVPEGHADNIEHDQMNQIDNINDVDSVGTPVWKVTKLQRKDITMLPRCEWRLANNNFLLHGYYNYRHLVLLDNGTILKLGVPGIYHEKEARAAESFGFPEFINAEETKLSLKPEECNKEELFGYWCRQVRRRSM